MAVCQHQEGFQIEINWDTASDADWLTDCTSETRESDPDNLKLDPNNLEYTLEIFSGYDMLKLIREGLFYGIWLPDRDPRNEHLAWHRGSGA